MSLIEETAAFLDHSPCSELATKNIIQLCQDQGYRLFDQSLDGLVFKADDKVVLDYYGSMVIAIQIPSVIHHLTYKITASHIDCPLLKVKVNGLHHSNGYTLVSTDVYGGPILYPWFDRPLKLVGKVVAEENGTLHTYPYDSKCPIATLPSLAIHFQGNVNNEFKIDNARDLQVMLDPTIDDLYAYIAKDLGIDGSTILDSDLYFANAQNTTIYPTAKWLQSSHLDDLLCAYGCLRGFLSSEPISGVNVYVAFDSEEIGSNTLTGALSTHLDHILRKVAYDLGQDELAYYQAVNTSFCISADNAHAIHPNRNDVYDAHSSVALNQGVVIKYSPRKAYTTSAQSGAWLKRLMKQYQIPYQVFENKAGVRGGGTLGGLSLTQVSVPTVDIGLPQLAMHSCYELAGIDDVKALVDLSKAFYDAIL